MTAEDSDEPDTSYLQPTPPLRLQVITDRAAFAQIDTLWNAMLMASPGATPFMTWQWLDAWLEEYCQADQQLTILTAWRGSRLVAGLPLLSSQRRWCGVLRVRQLELIGTGEPEWEEVCSEYSDLVAETNYMAEAVALFATYLQVLAWDKFVLRKILDDSLLLSRLLPLLPQATAQRQICGYRYRVNLPSNAGEYRNSLSKRMGRRIRRAEKLKSSSMISTEVIDEAGMVSVALAELRTLHQTRWQQAGKPGAFRSSRFSRFHASVTASFLRAGWLQLQRVTDQNEAILINYNIRFGDTEYYYQSGFNLDRYRNYSLGVMAHLQAIDRAIEDGLVYYDFMHSVGDSYKDQYNCQLTAMDDINLIKQTRVGLLLLWKQRIVLYLKKFRSSPD